jgi:serine/threonine protein kinase
VARYLFQMLANALVYLHDEACIVHRDIKLDNILYESEDH